MRPFTQDLERDAQLVMTSAKWGLQALASQAMLLPEFEGGPDRLQEHADWLNLPENEEYTRTVVARVSELLDLQVLGERRDD